MSHSASVKKWYSLWDCHLRVAQAISESVIDLEVEVKKGFRLLIVALPFVLVFSLSGACAPKATPEPTQFPTGIAPMATEFAPSATVPEITSAPPTEALPTEQPLELLYEDDFEDPQSGWEHYRQADGILDYEEGGYRMWVNVPENLFWVNLPEIYADVRLEVEAKAIGGPEANWYGVLCRLDQRTSDHYYFLISSSATYQIGKQVEWEKIVLAESNEPSDAVRLGLGETNHLRVDCMGEGLKLEVNGQVLLEVKDSELQEGAVGLLTGTMGEAGTDVLFDNFRLYGSGPIEGAMQVRPFELASTAFAHEEEIPERYTCDGEDISPPLQWGDPPAGTQSFALICDDPDAPGGTWVHWLLYNLSTDVRGLPEAVPAQQELADGSQHGRNSWGRSDYGGPCPPRGTHRYIFTLYALDTTLDLAPGADKATLLQAMEGHVLAETALIGLYAR